MKEKEIKKHLGNYKKLKESFIELLIDCMNEYGRLPCSHRMTDEEYYQDEIKLIEKCVDKKWQDILEDIKQ